MERPENIIDPKYYDKPQSFERDWDAEIYYSYIEAQKYIDYLESEVKKFRLGDVVGRSEQYHCEPYDFGRKDKPCDKQCEGCKAMNLD
jgi:hypothetical protein